MCNISESIPNETPHDTLMTPTEAAAYYIQGNASIGYCAKLAGMCEEDFIAFLGQHGIGIFDHMTKEELLRDIANA